MLWSHQRLLRKGHLDPDELILQFLLLQPRSNNLFDKLAVFLVDLREAGLEVPDLIAELLIDGPELLDFCILRVLLPEHLGPFAGKLIEHHRRDLDLQRFAHKCLCRVRIFAVFLGAFALLQLHLYGLAVSVGQGLCRCGLPTL